jgi:two-component system, OmpR family, aerobic respiration control sensor histidine kinase ArcB
MNKIKKMISIKPQALQSLINAISDPIVWISEHNEVLGINKSAEKVWNIKNDNLVGYKLSYTLLPYQIEESTLNPSLIRIKGKESQGLIVQSESPTFSNNKNWDVISRSLLSASTQKHSNDEAQLQDIYHYMENIIAEIPISVYWMNKDYIYLGCSNDMAKLLRLKSRHDIVGKTYRDLYDEQSGAHYKRADQKVIQKGVSLSLEEPLYQPDGTKEVYLSKKVPLKNPQGIIIGMLGISVNITERIKMEQALELAKEQAEAANRAKTEFIANMSHDIRTPLTGVIGLSELLEHTLQNDTDREKAHLLHDSGEELLHMLNEILDDVRAGNLKESDIKTELFDVHQCIRDLIRLELPTTTLKHLELRAEIAPNVPRYLRSDRNKIHRILLNLLGNAIKFTQTGSITLAIECLHTDNSKAHLKFSVSDTGIGIPEDAQAQVFNRFFKVSSSYKGVYTGHGLGLHIAQSYVTLLGGHITLTSKEGQGSTFNFDLECELGSSPAAESTSIPAQKSTTKKHQAPLHLLLVEDNVIALKTLEFLLSQKGYTFHSATTGEEAMTLFQEHPFDLIITDIGLPGISGHELSRRIRSHQSNIPIIALTGHVSKKDQEDYSHYGINEVLSKPAQINVLHEYIQKLSQNSSQPFNSKKKPLSGLDLPDTEDELFQLDNFPLFDEHSALKQIADKSLLITLLHSYLSAVARTLQA